MTLFHRFCVFLGRLTRTIIVIPHPMTVGNTAEDIYFGLLKARHERKKLALFLPYQLPGRLRLPLTNREVVAVESEYRAFRRGSLIDVAGSVFITLLFGFFRGLSMVRQKLGREPFSEWYTVPMTGQDILWKPEGRMEQFSWAIVDAYRWPEQLRAPIDVHLDERKRRTGESLKSHIGLPGDAWFVCLHVREPGYWNDKDAGAPRNASIGNYVEAIREVTRRGGWVVRMGDPSMTRLPPMERVIDYPFTDAKSELMDAYLLSECRLYIGMQSGIFDVAVLFQRPIILTNMPAWLFPFPLKRGDTALFKHVFCKSRGRFLSIKEWLSEPWGATAPNPSQADYEYHENTPEELRTVVAEYFDRGPEWQPAPLQLEFNRFRATMGKRLLSGPLIPDDLYSDIHSRYRFASRLEAAAGVVGLDFLRNNWETNARNRLAGTRETTS
jgi:putative glycosyltransferase (TIGR04372 family)